MNSVVLQVALSFQVRADQLTNLCRSVCIVLESYMSVTTEIKASLSVVLTHIAQSFESYRNT